MPVQLAEVTVIAFVEHLLKKNESGSYFQNLPTFRQVVLYVKNLNEKLGVADWCVRHQSAEAYANLDV